MDSENASDPHAALAEVFDPKANMQKLMRYLTEGLKERAQPPIERQKAEKKGEGVTG